MKTAFGSPCAVEGQRAGDAERGRGVVDAGRERLAADVSVETVAWQGTPGGVVVGGGQVSLGLAAAASATWVVPSTVRREPVTEVPGLPALHSHGGARL